MKLVTFVKNYVVLRQTSFILTVEMAGPAAKKRSNLRDVARKSGVSVATVSRVLNMPEKVSVETRDRVISVIEELQFMPSAAARAINSGRTRTVGALVPTLDNSIFARFLVGLENRLANFGISLVVAATEDDPEIEAAKARELVSIGTEGLIVSGITHSDAFEDLVRRAQMPVVAISYYDESYHLPTVGYDNNRAAHLAMSHLLSLGHKRIAVTHGPTHNNDRTRTRIAAIESYRPDADLEFFETDIAVSGGCAAARAIIQVKRKVSAILCLSDVLASGVVYELQRNGVDVPGDVSVMGMEDLPSSAFICPTLTTIHLPVVQMGVKAAEALGTWVESHERPDPVCLPAELIVRDSTTMLKP